MQGATRHRTRDRSVDPVILVIDKGSRDGVNVGFTFDFYAAGQYKGPVWVSAVQERSCTALVIRRWEENLFEVGDSASTRI